MISPTRLGIRNDQEGFGYFDAPRGGRRHKGTDFLTAPGTEVIFPFDSGKALRMSYPYGDTQLWEGVKFKGIEEGKVLYFKMFYFRPIEDIFTTKLFKQGDVVGMSQDITERYPKLKNMKPHVHLQIEGVDSELFLKGLTP